MKRVQFCSGGNKLAGFDNFDRDCDITKPLPFPDGSYEFVFIEHGAEHFSAPDAFRFFEECWRILKPDGVLRVCVPELTRLDFEHARDIIVNHGHLCVWCKESLEQVLYVAGFNEVWPVEFNPSIDQHWKVIGEEKDKKETLRIEARKAI